MSRPLLLLLTMTLAGCAWFREPPPPPTQKITPGARIIYNGGVAVWAVCDRGNLIYMAEGTPQIAIVPNGCPLGSP